MYERSQISERRGRPRRFGASLLAGTLAISLAACLKVSSPAAASAAGPLKQTPDGRPLQMTFEDEFETFRPWRDGHGVWRTVFKDGRDDPELRTLSSNHELQLYVDPNMRIGVSGSQAAQALDPFAVHDGVLDIVARPTPPGLVRALPQSGGRALNRAAKLRTVRPGLRLSSRKRPGITAGIKWA